MRTRGKTSLGAGTLIDDSGKVTYYYEDPSQSSIGTGDARVNGVTFTLSTANEVSVTTGSCMVSIPWDRTKVTTAMTAAAETLTFYTIKGENETSTAVTKTLTLPVRLDTCGWSTISWASSSVVVTVEDKGPLTPAEGTIHPNDTDTPVTLTATFTFNKNIDDYNKDVEAPITVTRTIEVTIPGAASDYMQTIQKICAEYTLARLTDFVTKEPIDPTNVTGDIQLLRSRNFTTVSFHTGSDGYAMTVTATALDGTATTYAAVNDYRLKICRLAETAGQVKLNPHRHEEERADSGYPLHPDQGARHHHRHPAEAIRARRGAGPAREGQGELLRRHQRRPEHLGRCRHEEPARLP